MMPTNSQRLQTLMTYSGLGWLFEAPDAEARAMQFASELQEAQQYYNERYEI